jgi:long-chain fatty acid transport protein
VNFESTYDWERNAGHSDKHHLITGAEPRLLVVQPQRRRLNRQWRSAALVALGGAGLGAGDAARAVGPAVTGIVAPAETAETARDNPAGLTRLQNPEWVGEVVGFAASSTDESSAITGRSRSFASNGGFAIPAVYYARPWNNRLTLGISLSVPAGIGSNPGDATIGRYLLEKWTLGYLSLAPAAGYRLNDRFSLGLALDLNYASYEYESAVLNGPGQADGTMRLKDGDFGVGFTLGALYEPTPTTRVGLAYHSSTTSHFSSTPKFSGLTPQRQSVLDAAGVLTRKVSLESRFPQALFAGAYHEFTNGTSVTLDVAWVNFSQFGLTQASVGDTSITTSNAKYNDIWAGSAGLSWPLGSAWTAKVGMAYATSGISNANRTYALRLDRIWGIGAGALYRWTKEKSVDVSLSYYDLGKAPVNVNVAGIGSLSAAYSTNYAIGLNISFRWERLNGAR